MRSEEFGAFDVMSPTKLIHLGLCVVSPDDIVSQSWKMKGLSLFNIYIYIHVPKLLNLCVNTVMFFVGYVTFSDQIQNCSFM